MQWYQGGIAQAITESKSKGAIFVVYIEGKNEQSEKITNLIESEQITAKLGSDNFVAIKLEANSVPHQQFSEIYKQTSVPSVYFIGKNGLPLEIITEASEPDDFSSKIDAILQKGGIKTETSEPSQNLIQNEQCQSIPPANVVCENGVCTIKRDQPSSSDENPAESGENVVSPEEKIERAKQLLEEKKKQKEEEEKENERQKEIERRKMGQSVQQMKKWQEEESLKQLLADREREKRESQAARERVLAQIAQDRAERASKFPTTQPRDAPAEVKEPMASTSKPNTARLQFKLPDGATHTHNFPSQDTLETVVAYIRSNLNLPSNNFTLSTTFPRRQFTVNDHSQTLADLGLTPNAVILILLLNHGTVTTNPAQGGLTGFIWTLLTPLLHLYSIVSGFIFGGGAGHVSGESEADKNARARQTRSNGVTHIRSKYDLEGRLKSAGNRLVVIDFFATWCGPCRMVAPHLEQMAREFPDVLFLKVDVDENGDIARDYAVSAMPTFVFLKNRREVTKFSGADVYQLRNTITRYR